MSTPHSRSTSPAEPGTFPTRTCFDCKRVLPLAQYHKPHDLTRPCKRCEARPHRLRRGAQLAERRTRERFEQRIDDLIGRTTWRGACFLPRQHWLDLAARLRAGEWPAIGPDERARIVAFFEGEAARPTLEELRVCEDQFRRELLERGRP